MSLTRREFLSSTTTAVLLNHRKLCAVESERGADQSAVGGEACDQTLETQKQVTAQLVQTARGITDRAAEEILFVESWEKVRSQWLEDIDRVLEGRYYHNFSSGS